MLPLGFAPAIVAGLATLAWPTLVDELAPPPWLWCLLAVPPLILAGCVCAFLQCVLASAAAGETDLVHALGSEGSLVLRALTVWMLCFLAGPILFAIVAFWFWLNAGDLTVVDWIVLAEVSAFGMTHWLLTLAAVHRAERLRDANPLCVAALVRRLGYGAVFATLGAVTVGLGIGAFVLWSLALLHEEPAAAVRSLPWDA